MSPLVENAESCFKRLLQESKSRQFHVSLERIKEACDTIEDMKGLLNYSRVAQYTENHFGGPKIQSIRNNDQHRLYIQLRMQEYQGNKQLPKKSSPSSTKPRYPSPDLDLKTKVAFDLLRGENDLLRKAMKELKEQILHETRQSPIDMTKAITDGPQPDLSLKLSKEAPENNEYLKLIQDIGQRLLQLNEDSLSPIKILTYENGKTELVLDNMIQTYTLLYDDELRFIINLLK